MRTHTRTVFGALAVAFVSALFALPAATAAVTIDNVALVESERVGRTTFRYTYQITVTNNLPVALENVAAYLTPPSDLIPPPIVSTIVDVTAEHEAYAPGTVFVDKKVEIGSMAAGETIVSDDVIILQQDRLFQLDADSLVWTIGYLANVTLTGVVTDEPISFADVEVIVDGGESGRPIIESGRPIIERYETTADEDGNYSVDVQFVADADFVSIDGDGVMFTDDDGDEVNQEFVALTSIAGSAGSLLEKATASADPTGRAVAQISVDGEDANPLNVTHVSTALAALAVEANGGAGFTNDEQLAAAQALIDTEELVNYAAVIKTVIDNANIGLPPGITTTQQLLDTPGAFEAFLVVLEEEFPDELEAAIEETIIDISTGYSAGEVPEMLYLREAPFDFNSAGAQAANVFTLVEDGTGAHIDSVGETTDVDWMLNAAGEIEVELNNPPVQETFPTVEVPPGSGDFEEVRQLASTTRLHIVRVAIGIASDQVLLGSTTLRTFPDHIGVLPDIVTVIEPSVESGFLAFEETDILPITADELAGEVVAVTYFHADNDSGGSVQFPAEAGADLLTFNPDGTGSTARRQFDFAWSIGAEGRLTITFANGDRTEYTRYAQVEDGQADLAIAIGRYGDGGVSAVDVNAVNPVDVTEFTEATLLNSKFRKPGALVGRFGLPRFDFNFLPVGIGCRDSGTLRDFTWAVTPQGFMSLVVTFGSPDFTQPRSWQAVATAPGTLGPRYWVIETLQSDDTTDGIPQQDPTVTPGRVTFYEDIKDISGNTPPTAVDDDVSTPVDTPVFIDVLANDTDAEDDVVLLNFVSGTEFGGTVEYSVDPTGIFFDGFIYTPPVGFSGVDTFTYSVVDSSCANGPPDAATVSVTVGMARPAPATKAAPVQLRPSEVSKRNSSR